MKNVGRLAKKEKGKRRAKLFSPEQLLGLIEKLFFNGKKFSCSWNELRSAMLEGMFGENFTEAKSRKTLQVISHELLRLKQKQNHLSHFTVDEENERKKEKNAR